jgi:hypothetical protein
MKKLQNNFTTPEQSKRLLELGLPADSADCIIKNNKHVYKYNFDMEPTMTQLIERLNTDDCMNVYNPCWSVGRLIEVMKICAKPKEQAIMAEEMLYCTDLVELLVYMIEANKQIMDFSKLE